MKKNSLTPDIPYSEIEKLPQCTMLCLDYVNNGNMPCEKCVTLNTKNKNQIVGICLGEKKLRIEDSIFFIGEKVILNAGDSFDGKSAIITGIFDDTQKGNNCFIVSILDSGKMFYYFEPNLLKCKEA